MKIAGKTTENKTVIKGVFPIFSSLTGLPLPDIIDTLYNNDIIIDWMDFYNQAMKEGWKPNRTLVKIKDSVEDVFGTEYANEVIKRINFCLDKGL